MSESEKNYFEGKETRLNELENPTDAEKGASEILNYLVDTLGARFAGIKLQNALPEQLENISFESLSVEGVDYLAINLSINDPSISNIVCDALKRKRLWHLLGHSKVRMVKVKSPTNDNEQTFTNDKWHFDQRFMAPFRGGHGAYSLGATQLDAIVNELREGKLRSVTETDGEVILDPQCIITTNRIAGILGEYGYEAIGEQLLSGNWRIHKLIKKQEESEQVDQVSG